ncbi:hypothetical protein J3R30DRAFT_3873140 [Lentinula aciculospora]|uniref:Zinc finger PHD-type domain-containing protein n=1 Tax=Lentinula aciculospora TaxID=153920 RepID=A0A9W9ADZ8_9AGAR|nr:hypothetical protein J3R30DRAFT_3873140 [Lentinula aciculospora]
MPRRTSARNAVVDVALDSSTSSATFPPQSLPENLVVLRKQWKWAACSQFFMTFSPLLAMDDVSLKVQGCLLTFIALSDRDTSLQDVEDDFLNNWQTTLRRQYNKRDPEANPIGPEPVKEEDYIRETLSTEPDSNHEGTNKGDNMVVVGELSEQSMSAQRENSDVRSEDDSTTSAALPGKLSISKTKDPSSDDQEKESKDWLSLPMLEKLDSLHLLTEWQFQSPARVRTLMRSDDDQASWRIEPIGYDAKRNAYWLIGADRLWIQRVPPKPPRPPPKNSLKRKRTANTSQAQAKSFSPNKRPRLQAAAKNRKAVAKSATEPISNISGRHGRAAKDQANLKLDAQAKELAELNRQAALMAAHSPKSSTRGATSSKDISSPARATRSTRPLGTRLSARLRGSEDDEWQAIPDEWLQNDDGDDTKGKGKGKRRSPSLPRSVSSVSELTELSEESEMEEVPAEETYIEEGPQSAEFEKSQEQISTPQNFVEWETIAVTLYEWEHIAEGWQNATHYSEKALYKVLKNHIVPMITEELKEFEVKRQKEEAVTQRKRSSRIAIKESEKEEARLAAKKKAEEEEKMSRARRLEARQRKEEVERIKRETAREQRRKEREAKEEREAQEAEEKETRENEMGAGRAKQRSSPSSHASPPSASNDVVLLHLPGDSNYNSTNGSARDSRSSRTSAVDDWELDCEICNRRGVNLDERAPLMSCALCSKWQHISCHDQVDRHAGRPRRNWDQVEFICRRCRMNARGSIGNGAQMQYPQTMNMHPSLVPSAPSPYNQVPYGQGLGFDEGAHMSNRYADVPATNGSRGSYGAPEARSVAAQANIDYSNTGQTPKQISFSHYQPQHHNFVRNGHEQRRYHDSSTVYGHSTQAHPYKNYGSHDNSQHEWNGASANQVYDYRSTSPKTSTYNPHSAERSSVIPESSSRLPHGQPVFSPQQQPWNPRSNGSTERFNTMSESHDQSFHHQQQWRTHHPAATSSSPPFVTSSTSYNPHPL